jgi:hypothetical protein
VWLIWNLRNKRVIQNNNEINRDPTPTMIWNLWRNAMEKNLHLDRAMTHRKFGRRALSKDAIAATWSEVIENEANLPEDWAQWKGVLVGIRLKSPP